MDGYLYQREGFDVLSGALDDARWERLSNPNSSANRKNHTFGHTAFMFPAANAMGPLLLNS